MDPEIRLVRSFHRTVTQRIGALNTRYLGRDRPLVESRLLYEIGTDGAEIRHLRARLDLDSGFLSRSLRSLERKGLIQTRRVTNADARVRLAQLTSKGKTELRKLNELSDQLAESILEPLGAEQRRRFVAAVEEVERILRGSSVTLSLEKPSSADAQRCLGEYFRELNRRFRSGFDQSKSISASAAELMPPRGYLIIARLFEQPVGCGALKITDGGVGEVKRMWVSTTARGLGIGRKILHELESIARARKLKILRLETNESLQEAQSLYRTSGYEEVAAFNDEPYAHHWFEKRLQ